ncbi:hypothetical protein [Desulforudis sp. DRI-14]|uniref:hypothetical protein n=1 Tax=Desulforudis sp. DRI-14 TaxID=3459793 RepID=UPI00404110A8
MDTDVGHGVKPDLDPAVEVTKIGKPGTGPEVAFDVPDAALDLVFGSGPVGPAKLDVKVLLPPYNVRG